MGDDRVSRVSDKREALAVEIVWVIEDSANRAGLGIERRTLLMTDGATIEQAVRALDQPDLLAGLASGALRAAVFGEHRPAQTVLHRGDRIELVGALLADAKQSRERRASVQREQGGDSRWRRR